MLTIFESSPERGYSGYKMSNVGSGYGKKFKNKKMINFSPKGWYIINVNSYRNRI